MNREEVIKKLRKLKLFCNDRYRKALNFAIESIKVDMFYDLEYEKIEQDSRWVPVNEKLPDKDGEYLCTIQIHNGTRVVRMTSFAKDLYAIDQFDFYALKGKAGWFDYDDGGYYVVSDVIAWDEKFKLPEPYQGESEEKK